MRSLLHLGLVASLLSSLALAPFQHAHKSDPHHEHAKGFFHIHSGSNLASEPIWDVDNHDSDARMLDWLAGDGSTPGKVVADLPESIGQPVLAVRVARFRDLTPHNHDPPLRPNLNPRGPPA